MGWRFVNDALPSEQFTGAGAYFTTDAFLHDRLMRAVYALIPDDCRQLVHLTVGYLTHIKRD